MIKSITPILSLVAISLLLGCGSDSIDEESKNIESSYDVVVERGPVFDANVTDMKGRVARQVAEGNNTYRFENTPDFPIHARGGWIDVDRDGNLTHNDIMLDINLTSYSNVITPLTTYIADANQSVREQKLQELEELTGVAKEELIGSPSHAGKNALIALNAVYEKLVERFKDSNNTQAQAPLAIENIIERYNEIQNNTNVDLNLSGEALAKVIEMGTIERLKNNGLLERLSQEKIEKFKDLKGKRED